MPVNDKIVAELGRRFREGHFPHLYWWVLTEAEANALNERDARADEALPKGLERWLAAERAEVWGGVVRLQRRPDASVLVLGFTERPEYHLAQARARSPHPELLEAEHVAMSARDEVDLQERVSGDIEQLSALGVTILAVGGRFDDGDDEDGGFWVSLCAEDEAAARRIIEERYGRQVRVEYLGREPTVLTRIPWATYEALSDISIVLRYPTNSCYEPAGIEVVESECAVTVTVTERAPVGVETLMAVRRQAQVTLRAPIADRVLIDGARNAERPRRPRP